MTILSTDHEIVTTCHDFGFVTNVAALFVLLYQRSESATYSSISGLVFIINSSTMLGKSIFSRFITSNNSWVLVSCIILFCFQWVMTIYDFGTVMYLHETKWGLFFELLGSFLLLLLPLLMYSAGRSWIRSAIGSRYSGLLWVLIFIVYPICIGLMVDLGGMIPVEMVSEMVTFVGLVLAGADVLTSGVVQLPSNMRWRSVTNRLSLEWIVVGFFVVIAFCSAVQLRQANSEETSLMLLFLQTLVPAMLYYLFYRANHYYLVDIVYRQKGLIRYAFGFLALMILFFVPIVAAYYYLPGYVSVLRLRLAEDWVGPEAPFTFYSIYVGAVTGVMFLTIPLTILIQWLQQRTRISDLQNQNMQTELALLKHQINPHFFFNTLNNIHALTLTKDPKADESILQLSDLMRYVIYKGKEDRVTIAEEVKYIEDYVKLHLMRVSSPVDYQFVQDIDEPSMLMPPLLLIILVENAIKHGVEGAEKASMVHIYAQQDVDRLIFTVRNSVEGRIKGGVGVGLDNLRRRLELLYPDRYILDLDLKDGLYSATLILNNETR